MEFSKGIKPRIAVIAGNISNARLLEPLVLLHGTFEVDIFAIESAALMRSYQYPMKLHLFENIVDMPGYMRSLEEHVRGYDLLVGFENSRLASFQMVRIAAKFLLPCICIVGEHRPFFYTNYSNIRAIQVDIMNQVRTALCMSKAAEAMLLTEGYPKEKLCLLHPVIDRTRFHRSLEARQRFRNYIQIDQTEFVVLFKESLEEWNRPLELLDSIRYLSVTAPEEFKRMRFVFAGDGSQAKELKYRAWDFKLTHHVLFLHQDPDTFVQDLYAASDVIICRESHRDGFHCEFPIAYLEAAASGVLPVYTSGGLLSEYLANHGFELKDQSYLNTAEAILNASRMTDLGGVVSALHKHMDHSFSAVALNKALQPLLWRLLTESANKSAAIADEQFYPQRIREILWQGKAHDALESTDALLSTVKTPKIKANLLCMKGDLLYKQSRFEESMQAYGESLQIDDTLVDAYRGLGFIAVQGHSHDEAMVFFKRALSKQENDAGALFGIGLVHRRLGLNEEAMYWLERCVEFNRDHRQARTALVQTCLECRNVMKSIATMERMLELEENDPHFVSTLEKLYARAGLESKISSSKAEGD